MRTLYLTLSFGVPLFLVACTSITSTQVLTSQPARAKKCSFDFVDVPSTESEIKESWVLLGFIETKSSGPPMPANSKRKNFIRPEVCNMGGTEVGIVKTTSSGGVVAGKTRTVYAVLLPRKGDETEGNFVWHRR